MIFSPDDKRVVENTAVHADGTVNLGIHDGVGADDHAVGQVVVFTAFRNCARQAQVIGIELRKVGGKRHIAGTDLAGFVLYDRVHRDAVIVQQLAPNRESIKLLDPAGSLADTSAEKHIEFQPALTAEPNQRRDIQRFEKSHHGIRRVHPKRIRFSTGSRFRIDNGWFHSSHSNARSSIHLAEISFTSPPVPGIFYLTEYPVSETDRPGTGHKS